MRRRDFTGTAAAAAAAGLGLGGAWLAGPAQAQGGFAEGRDFVRLSTPLGVPPGKIDLVEFFWYGCPHCYAFEPMLDAWSRKLPPDVAFRRVHVSFTALHETHAKLFYALEASGQWSEAVHRKVFAAIHQQHLRLDKEADIVAFVGQAGLDAAKFTDAYRSFGVATKARQGKQLSEGYKIDGVPALGVQGRWFTAPSLAGGPERALEVADYLVAQARKAA